MWKGKREFGTSVETSAAQGCSSSAAAAAVAADCVAAVGNQRSSGIGD